VDTLTAREVDVLRLLVSGYTNRQIAERLSVSVRTIEGHRANITSKLGLHSRVDLADYAEKHRLLY
jgi:two-component system response regulator FimZ (fimbrial Z protein)